jgi:inositol-phosphate phosphatase/L-galactose 1-phosphate phosphatase/histidinol-phosphatase
VRDTIWGGDCYNYALLASGHLDLVVEANLKLYDFAALVPVVEGAGGRMTDWAGKPLGRDSDGRVIAAGDPALIEAAIEALSA